MITGQPYSRATNHNFTTTGNPADVGSTATDPDVTDVGTALSFFQNDGSFNQATSATAVVSGSGFTQALYLQEAGDITAISVDDLHQGQIGDCFLLSSIGELALRYMGAISDMIHANGDGTETVRLYAAADGQVPTHGTSAYKAVSINVDNSFPSYSVNEAATQDVVGGKKEIWPQVIEKAMAIEDGGYDAIAHGGQGHSVLITLCRGRAAGRS